MGYKETLGCSFSISGKPNLKKPIVLLGNVL